MRVRGSATIITEMGRKGSARGAASQPARLGHSHQHYSFGSARTRVVLSPGPRFYPFSDKRGLERGATSASWALGTDQRLRQMGHRAGMRTPSPAWHRDQHNVPEEAAEEDLSGCRPWGDSDKWKQLKERRTRGRLC